MAHRVRLPSGAGHPEGIRVGAEKSPWWKALVLETTPARRSSSSGIRMNRPCSKTPVPRLHF